MANEELVQTRGAFFRSLRSALIEKSAVAVVRVEWCAVGMLASSYYSARARVGLYRRNPFSIAADSAIAAIRRSYA